jgi:hypothetical protein
MHVYTRCIHTTYVYTYLVPSLRILGFIGAGGSSVSSNMHLSQVLKRYESKCIYYIKVTSVEYVFRVQVHLLDKSHLM